MSGKGNHQETGEERTTEQNVTGQKTTEDNSNEDKQAEKKEEKLKKCSSAKPTSWRSTRRRRRSRRGRGVASRQGDYGCRLPPHGVGGCDAACRWGATQAAVLPGPGSLTEPILLPVPLASPGPRHPAGPSALQPQRSTAARHSTPGPAPLLMHMQPYSGAILSFTNPSTTDTHTYTHNYNQRNYEKWVSTSTIHSEHNRPGPKHSLITIHSHTQSLTHASRNQRPPTIPQKTLRWHP